MSFAVLLCCRRWCAFGLSGSWSSGSHRLCGEVLWRSCQGLPVVSGHLLAARATTTRTCVLGFGASLFVYIGCVFLTYFLVHDLRRGREAVFPRTRFFQAVLACSATLLPGSAGSVQARRHSSDVQVESEHRHCEGPAPLALP